MTILPSESAKSPDPVLELNRRSASDYARQALGCLRREYPNHPGHVMADSSRVLNPKSLHPAFYGCYDWHSSVHGHWLLAFLLRLYPTMPEAQEIRSALGENLTADNLLAEADYFRRKENATFERTYGWAWLLKLAVELRGWEDEDAKRWEMNLRPLADVIIDKYLCFLPRLAYPVRTGVHSNTAFGLALALDYARTTGEKRLEELITERSRTYYSADTGYPAAWELGGEDFLSPALAEANLMRRVLGPERFVGWFHRFLPGVRLGEPKALLNPAQVTDLSDPRIVHLVGLNLSRAWFMREIAVALPQYDPARDVLIKAAREHARAALPLVASGDYAGEHWLATFAVCMLSPREH